MLVGNKYLPAFVAADCLFSLDGFGRQNLGVRKYRTDRNTTVLGLRVRYTAGQIPYSLYFTTYEKGRKTTLLGLRVKYTAGLMPYVFHVLRETRPRP
jgi:hypothetical protein